MPVQIPMDPYGEVTDEEIHKQCFEWVRSKFGGMLVTNLHSGDLIRLTSKGIRHSTNRAARPRLETLSQLEEIVRLAQKTGEVLPKDANVKLVHKYEIDVECRGRLLQTLIVVKEDHSGAMNFYDLAFAAG